MSSESFTTNIFSLKQMSKTGSLDAIFVLREQKLDLTSPFLEIQSITRF